jgi:hypothetical protein
MRPRRYRKLRAPAPKLRASLEVKQACGATAGLTVSSEQDALMSGLLRRLPISRLLLACGALVAVGAACTALASALGDEPKPAPKPLAQALHDALTAPKVDGLSARVSFVDHLIEGASLQGQDGGGSGAGANPLISGGEGRVWISASGQLRLELQSEGGATQILYHNGTLTIYQASSDTLYECALPQGKGESSQPQSSQPQSGSDWQPPSVAKIQEAITRLMGHVDLSGAMPTDVAGRPAYAVRISPKSDGGLIGGAELAWDAGHGVPLKLAVYAKGDASPVLALTATEVSYGPVPSSAFSLALPAGVKRTKIAPHQGSSSTRGRSPRIDAQVSGLSAVQAKLPFALQAPASLAGMSRHEVRLIEVNGHDSALIGYGEGLGGFVVIESEEGESGPSSDESSGEGAAGLQLPHVSIGAAKASELPTALGTILSFDSAGIDHVLAGSVTPTVLQAAARGL